MNNEVSSPTAVLLDSISSLDLHCVPEQVREKAKDLLLDHLGVSLYGATLPRIRIVRYNAEAEASRPECTLYGGMRVSARAAAQVNATAGHAIELDDTHDESLSHPGCVVIPAALAIAESIGACGAVFLAGVIGGYEAQCRIGATVGEELYKRGFHPTAQCGVFGAAAAAGRILGLPIKNFNSAFGIGASMASGTMKFTQDPEGTMVKRLHAGIAAEHGVLAAQLAFRGFSGPREAIEGAYGFAQLFAGKCDVARMTRDLGREFEIERISVKLYPCCRLFHALIEAIGECRAETRFAANEVMEIRAFGPRSMIDGHMERRPLSEMAAQYSLPYTAAIATLSDAADPASFGISMMTRPDILALVDKVQGEANSSLEKHYPRKLPAAVRFRMRDGHEIERTVLDSRSTPVNPISRDDIQAKFLSLTSALLVPREQEQVIEAVMNIDRAETVGQLTGFLREIAERNAASFGVAARPN